MLKKLLISLMLLCLCISAVSCSTSKNTTKATTQKPTQTSTVSQTSTNVKTATVSASIASSTAKATTSPASTASTGTLALGQSYGGGVIAYLLQPEDPGYSSGQQHGLIVATADITKAYTDPWNSTAQTILFRWTTGSYTVASSSDYAYQQIGTISTAIGQGLSNTTKIITKFPAATYPNTAAAVARAYNGGGFTDWFLPSRDELNKIFLNKASVGGIKNDYYWSSSEFDVDDGWAQNLYSGEKGNAYKYNLYRVRAVRAF